VPDWTAQITLIRLKKSVFAQYPAGNKAAILPNIQLLPVKIAVA